MSVIPFPRIRRARTVCATDADRSNVRKNAIARTIDDLYHYAPQELRQTAALCARDCIDQGGGFMDAMDAAQMVIEAAGVKPYAPSTEAERIAAECARNAMRIARFLENRARLRAARLAAASEIIRDRMRGHTQDDITAAIERARRIIDGNGLIATALWFGLGEDLYTQFIDDCNGRYHQ